jgi:hypothetical protein
LGIRSTTARLTLKKLMSFTRRVCCVSPYGVDRIGLARVAQNASQSQQEEGAISVGFTRIFELFHFLQVCSRRFEECSELVSPKILPRNSISSTMPNPCLVKQAAKLHLALPEAGV